MRPAEDEGRALARLCGIMKILRKECPWDRVQTHESLRRCMIEEAYEAVEAVDNQDWENLSEELGDVLLQVLFHASLAEEEGRFSLVSLINEECEKMIRRHPHVFSGSEIKTVDKVLEKWENIKDEEHFGANHTERLRRVPKALPALIRSEKIQSKAAQCGFDWDDVTGAFQKVAEETEELIEACHKESKKEIAEEIGDLLFSVVNVSRFLEVDPEEALDSAADKFIERFAYIERTACQMGRSPETMSLEEMDRLWEESKDGGCPKGDAHKREK